MQHRQFLSIFLSSVLVLNSGAAIALPVVDATLGSQPTLLSPTFMRVDGGTVEGQNLFHSFESFTIGETESVYFFSPAEINHIFSRVTGNSRSDINGVLGTFGSDADLFLMNPNGVVFGSTASLDVQGSLIVTTASAIGFGESGVFSSSISTTDQLLAVDPSVFWFNGPGQPGAITNQSRVNTGLDPSGSFNTFGLRVPSDADIIFLGGNIFLEGGGENAPSGLYAPGGHIELGAIAGNGAVAFNAAEGTLILPESLVRADIKLSNNAGIRTLAEDSGDISIYANNLEVLNSLIGTGVVVPFGTIGGRAGDLSIDSTGTVLLDGSVVSSIVAGIGEGGSVTIRAQNINLVNGSAAGTVGIGTGDAGDVTLDAATNISFSGRNVTNNSSSGLLASVFSLPGIASQGNGGNIWLRAASVDLQDGAIISSTVFSAIDSPFATGTAGNILIFANGISVTDGSQINSSSTGFGNAGDITINADHEVVFAHANDDESIRSGLTSTVGSGGVGTGGDITINAYTLEVLDGAVVNASTSGGGDTGNVIIDVQDSVLIDGTTPINQLPSAIGAEVEVGSTGTGGLVSIAAENLFIRNGGVISASTFGNGPAGNIDIEVRGNIRLDGASVNETWKSGILSAVGPDAQGEGGDLIISAEMLEVLNGALITASVFGTGPAGDIIITIDDQMVVSGTTPNGSSSLILSKIEPGGEGLGGNISIDTGTLAISNTAAVSASTQGIGDAGDVVIRARDSVNIESVILPETSIPNISGVFTRNFNLGVIGTGEGGDIFISTPNLMLTEGGVLDAQTANDRAGGNIVVEVGRLSLLQGGHILAASNDVGPAGTVRINAREYIQISGVDPDAEIRRISLAALGETYQPESNISVISLGIGSTGDILINSPEVVLTDGGQLVAASATADGGNIILSLDELLLLRHGSQITATAGTAQGQGNGGNITINAPFIVAIPTENSDITADAFSGTGGRVNITAQGVFGIEPRPSRTPLSDITASSDLGVSGIISLNSLDTSFIQNDLADLPDLPVNPDTLVANSCVVRSQSSGGTLAITGSDAIDLPSDPVASTYPIGGIRTISEGVNFSESHWQAGDEILEPHGVYQLADGRLVMSRACS